MNKNAGIFFGVVMAVMVFMCGVLFIEHISDCVTEFRTDLNCSSPSSISDGTKLLCLAGGISVPYFIISLLSITAGFIGEKLI